MAMHSWPVLMLVLVACLALTACPQRETGGGGMTRQGDPKLLRAEPLAEPLQGSGFTELNPTETGLAFDNRFATEMTLTRTLVQQSGVAAGDFNNDRLIDLFITGLDADNKLFRNDGDWKFTDVTAEAGAELAVTGFFSNSATFADLDGDGNLDLLVAVRTGSDRLFMGDGKGGFTEETEKRGLGGHEDATVQYAVFDANNDGWLDLYKGCHRQHEFTPIKWDGSGEIPAEYVGLAYMDDHGRVRHMPEPDRFYLNNGKGVFEEQTGPAGLEVISYTNGVHAADFNDDGWADLYVSADFAPADRLFLNNQDGTFTDAAKTHLRKTVLFGMSIDTGDINGDGMIDFFAGDMLARDGVRAKRQSGDMNQWRQEMLYDKPQPQMRNMFYINRGDGWFSEVGQMVGLAASDWTWSCRIADLNCNGQMDVLTTTGVVRDYADVDSIMQRGALAASDWWPTFAELDYLKKMPEFNTINHIFTRGDDPLRFSLTPGNWGMEDSKMSCGVVLTDLDGDGDLDAVINNSDDLASVYRNDFGTGNRVSIDLRAAGKNSHGVGARLWAHSGDDVFVRDVLLARGFASSEASRVFFGLGEHERIDRLVIRWPDGTTQEHHDLAANLLYTIQRDKRAGAWEAPHVETYFTTSELDWEQKELDTQAAEFLFEPLLPMQQTLYGTGVAVADFDGDDVLDAYFAGAAGQVGELMTGDGKGGFTASGKSTLAAESEEMAALAFRTSPEDHTLFVTSGGMEGKLDGPEYKDGLFKASTGSFTSASLPDECRMDGAVAAADINGDGHLDLFVAGHIEPYAYGVPRPNCVLLNDGSGNYSDATASIAPDLVKRGQIADAQFADMNGDGLPDLLLAINWGPVELWLNEGGKFNRAQQLAPRGWWRSLGVGDFNADGRLDVIVGNTGKNTKYSPKPDQPVLMYAADFDGNETRDLIEVKYKADGSPIPSRGRSCSGYAIGYIPEKFPTWASFSTATLEEVYGHKIPVAEKFVADELQSVILLNTGDSFELHHLPGAAQWTPAFGIAVGDYDADGKLDAFIAMNFTPTQPETGAWNSGYGVLLQGQGDGTFRDVDVPQAGVRLYQDGRGAIPADFNGDGMLDILFSVSNGKPQVALANPAKSAGSGLLVNLEGRASNPGAVGARLSLELDNGATLIREVQAGSGYLSSYSGPVHFGIPEGSSAARLSIRWPDGKSSEITELSGPSVTVKY